MSYVLRVRFASFFTGAAVASGAGLYFLQKDYSAAHDALSKQMNSLYESLDGRLSELEKLRAVEAPRNAEAEAPRNADPDE